MAIPAGEVKVLRIGVRVRIQMVGGHCEVQGGQEEEKSENLLHLSIKL